MPQSVRRSLMRVNPQLSDISSLVLKMSSHPPDPLELDDITLPPIPGAIPSAFFSEIPPQSLAIFSTSLSTRPFRYLPNPAPPHVVRSGNDNDIKNKAWSLLHTYHEVTESIFTPPAAWQDLYHYFDAMDIWTEGAGFLFHVLGFIVKINWTRFKCLRTYADQWALTNEIRLISMPLLQANLLNLVFTAEDDAWFDVGNLTTYQKNALVVVLNSHRAMLQAKHDSRRIAHQREVKWAAKQTQRPADISSPEPHQYHERPSTPFFKSTSVLGFPTFGNWSANMHLRSQTLRALASTYL